MFPRLIHQAKVPGIYNDECTTSSACANSTEQVALLWNHIGK